MKLILLFLGLIFSFTAFSDQNLDLILNGKLINSTTVLTPSMSDLEVTCLSNRNIIVYGDFTAVTKKIKFLEEDCKEGVIFTIRNIGTGSVQLINHLDEVIDELAEDNKYEVYYHSGGLSFIAPLAVEGLDLLEQRVSDLESLNIQTRLLSIESLNIATRLSALEGTNYEARISSLEGANSDFRIDALEAINSGTRLGLLESYNLNSRVTALESGGSSFNATSSPSIIPTTDNTYTLGHYASPFSSSDNKSWLQVVTNEISGNKFGNNGQQPYQFTNRLNIKTRDNTLATSGFSGSTATMWIKTGYNSGGTDYTGQLMLSTGSSLGTDQASTDVDARSGGIYITTGRATPKGLGTSTIGGITIATGAGPVGNTDATTLPQPAFNDQVTISGGQGVRFTSADGVNVFTKGAIAIAGSATYNITPTECPSGSCTSASPLLISSLGLTPAITGAACTSSPTTLCAAEIVLNLNNSNWTGNTATKYICIQGIGAGFTAGQRLRVKVLNGTYNNSTVAQRVGHIIVGFASPRNPITGCSYNTTARFSLKYSAPTSASMPADTAMVPDNQYISSHADLTSSGILYPYGIGSAEFQFVSGGVGWHQI